MTKKQKIVAIVIFVIVVAVALYFWFKEPKVELLNTVTTPGTTPVVVTKNTPTANDEFPLVKGSKGDRVKSVQTAVNKINPAAKLTVDGVLGNDTYTAIVAFVGTKYYPVTAANFTTIIQKSQAK